MRIYDNFNLKEYNSYHLEAVCKRAFFPENDEDIIELFATNNADYVLLGAGYNVILSKSHYDDDFVIFSGNYNRIELIGSNQVLCESGANMKEVSEFALANSLVGVEIFYDIPSSLGGAVVMNAGAGGEDIRGVLLKVWYFDPNRKQILEISKDQIGFEYRNSFFQRNPQMIVCKALLSLENGRKEDIQKKMERIKEERWTKQPRDFPNAGSVFKRPPGRFVGPMIDELGLKGYSIGGAKISEKHGGFIINYNGATGDDIISLIQYVKDKVFNKFEVNLEIEQRII